MVAALSLGLVEGLNDDGDLADEDYGEDDHYAVNHPIAEFQTKECLGLVLAARIGLLSWVFLESHVLLLTLPVRKSGVLASGSLQSFQPVLGVYRQELSKLNRKCGGIAEFSDASPCLSGTSGRTRTATPVKATDFELFVSLFEYV